MGNLPGEPTSFVGRASELAEVGRLARISRLLTLTGPGGVGKTRLALRAAAELAAGSADGVWLVELAALQDPDLVVHTIGGVLGVPEHASQSPVDALARHLADKHLLLVLDNCEHLVDSCALLADVLLRAAPGLRILVTSRQVLDVAGEHIFVVPPLGAEAVPLFAARAVAVQPDFALTPANTPAVARLCAGLDGLPLAIELAAVLMRSLSAEQIADRLDQRFDLLAAGHRGAELRHQTLRTAIGWSHELCKPHERLLWARASVFAGGFDLEAAEQVCGDEELEDVLGSLMGLVDKSILTREDHAGGVRYRMLDSIRAYGAEWLSSLGAEAAFRRRHKDYFQRLVMRSERDWYGKHHAQWSLRLRGNQDNVRAALEFCLAEPGLAPAGLAMTTVLAHYWISAGLLAEARLWLDRALDRVVDATPLRAKALWSVGWVATLQGDGPAAAERLEDALELAAGLGFEAGFASALQYTAGAAVFHGDLSHALEFYEEALIRQRALGGGRGIATLMIQVAFAHCIRADVREGDLDRALALCEEALVRCTASEERWCLSQARYVQALTLWQRGDLAQAQVQARAAVRHRVDLLDRPGAGMGLALLSWIAAAEGRYKEAAFLAGAAERIWDDLGIALSGIAQLLAYREKAARQARRALGKATYRLVLDQGWNASLDEVLRI